MDAAGSNSRSATQPNSVIGARTEDITRARYRLGVLTSGRFGRTSGGESTTCCAGLWCGPAGGPYSRRRKGNPMRYRILAVVSALLVAGGVIVASAQQAGASQEFTLT